MTVKEAINNRKSIRKYLSKPVEEEKLTAVLEAGRLAPSSRNSQNWKFIVVKNDDVRERLAEACHSQKFLRQAPIAVAVCATSNEDMPCNQPSSTVNCCIAMSFMMLQAAELGLSGCWLGAFDEDEVKKVLGIPENVRVVAVTPLGYADESGRDRTRKAFDEVVCVDSYK